MSELMLLYRHPVGPGMTMFHEYQNSIHMTKTQQSDWKSGSSIFNELENTILYQ